MGKAVLTTFHSSLLGLALASSCAGVTAQELQFVFTSDAHYGITRKAFRGARNVDAHTVNAALVDRINSLPGVTLPADGGLRAGQPVGTIDFVVEGGDLSTRQEHGIQSASASWFQFKADYVDRLEGKDAAGRKVPLFLIPGNHDASNAVGYFKPMRPLTDSTPMVEMYKRMMDPATAKTAGSYRYAADPIHYARTLGGIHFVFAALWPDTATRAWMKQDLQALGPSTPVILFTHDPPELPLEHLSSPSGNATDRFENLLGDHVLEGESAGPRTRVQQALTDFLKAHANITAWFHGHANWHEAYTWAGADGSLALPVFRVDSPMKGRISAKDETKLSFHLVTIDPRTRRMTVRECLWNADPGNPSSAVVFGGTTTVSLAPGGVEGRSSGE